ncbi:MAG: hypothetical protein ACLQMT_10100 [Candidatus Acidiferrales bacterium]
MIHFRRLSQYFFAVSLATLSLLPNAAAKPRIVPLRTSVHFSPRSSLGQWSVPIKSIDGRTVYVLSLEPDFSVGNHLATLTLVLRHFGDKDDAPNLLDPAGIWHGIQPCDFVANDLAQGAQKSVFGDKRTISRKDLGFVVRIIVSKAVVSPISAGNYQLDALDLQIEVNNSNP